MTLQTSETLRQQPGRGGQIWHQPPALLLPAPATALACAMEESTPILEGPEHWLSRSTIPPLCFYFLQGRASATVCLCSRLPEVFFMAWTRTWPHPGLCAFSFTLQNSPPPVLAQLCSSCQVVLLGHLPDGKPTSLHQALQPYEHPPSRKTDHRGGTSSSSWILLLAPDTPLDTSSLRYIRPQILHAILTP